MNRSSRVSISLAVMMVLTGDALAQGAKSDFPNRPLRYIVAFPPGGASDIIARIVADALSERLGQQVVIDNRSGASGTIGAEVAARATADGYTLFGCNIASLAVSPALYRKLGYDPGAFEPIGLMGSNPNVLVVHPSVPATTVAQFVAHSKSRPGKLNYGSAWVGTSPQLSMELFKKQAGIDLVHIPYKGGGPLVVALIGGEIQASFSTVPTMIGPIRSGKARVLGVTSTTRFSDLPDVPTIAESGSRASRSSPGRICARREACRKRRSPGYAPPCPRCSRCRDMGKRFADQGFQRTPLAHEQFAAFTRAERTKWSKLVREVGIEPL